MSRLDEALARLERAVMRLEAACAGIIVTDEPALRPPEMEGVPRSSGPGEIQAQPDRLGRAGGE